MAPQRVAVYVPSLEGGGAERVMATVASTLARRGYEVDLLLAQKTGPYLNELAPEVNIIDFDKSRVLHTLIPLVKYLRDRRPDVLLSAMGHTNVISQLATTFSVHTPRVVLSERRAPRPVSTDKKDSKLTWFLTKWAYSRADAIVAVSDGVGRELSQYLGISQQLVRTIYNPMNTGEIRRLGAQAVQHPWFDASHQVFIAVGRLVPVKDFTTLLKAFSQLAPHHPMARLIIVGDGPSYEALIELSRELGIEDIVDLVGFQSNPYAWMAASDVFVLSSISEGLPNAMLQAMACGLKIVSTDCNYGPAEILSEGKWGRLVPVGDAETLAQQMSLALSDGAPPDVRARAEDFRIEAIMDQYSDVLALGA